MNQNDTQRTKLMILTGVLVLAVIISIVKIIGALQTKNSQKSTSIGITTTSPTLQVTAQMTQPVSTKLNTTVLQSQWLVTTTSLQNGTRISVRAKKDVHNAIMDVQITPIGRVVVETIANQYKGLHFTEAPVTLSGIRTQTFKGTLPLTSPAKQEIAVVFQKNASTYFITYDYDSPLALPEEESTFRSLLQSLTFP